VRERKGARNEHNLARLRPVTKKNGNLFFLAAEERKNRHTALVARRSE
jgi:hypothetical protein